MAIFRAKDVMQLSDVELQETWENSGWNSSSTMERSVQVAPRRIPDTFANSGGPLPAC